MAEVFNVTVREQLGKRNTRRLRKAGQVPAVLYGRGEENWSLAVPHEEVEAVMRHGARLVELAGAVSETALIREVQWDAFGSEVLHVDLTRVSADERVTVTVPVTLRGVAPGTREGGVVDHQLHQLTIDCPAGSIPEKLEVSINGLALNDVVTVADLELPDNSEAAADAGAIVVQCIEVAEQEETPAEITGAEPEVIGRSADDEDGEGDG